MDKVSLDVSQWAYQPIAVNIDTYSVPFTITYEVQDYTGINYGQFHSLPDAINAAMSLTVSNGHVEIEPIKNLQCRGCIHVRSTECRNCTRAVSKKDLYEIEQD